MKQQQNNPITPVKAKKPRKPRAGLSLKQVNLEKLHKQLMNVLSRETTNLLILSHKDKLGKDDAASLCNYLKLMKQLEEKEEETLNSLTDEQLEKMK